MFLVCLLFEHLDLLAVYLQTEKIREYEHLRYIPIVLLAPVRISVLIQVFMTNLCCVGQAKAPLNCTSLNDTLVLTITTNKLTYLQ